MEFRIADSFTESLAKLTGQEQKAVKTTAFDLQITPDSPALQCHKVEGAKDNRFWSIHVNQDIRLIIHKSGKSLLLCYVDHHDEAYRWAERRKLETHPKTGAAQMVEIRETVKEFISSEQLKPERSIPRQQLLFKDVPDNDLLRYGVPVEWLDDVKAADEESLLELAEHLPAEAGEALIDLAIGEIPKTHLPSQPDIDPFEHPDAQRRFRIMNNIEELKQALEYPWDKWTIFLHPEQRHLVERNYNGPARISGSAGTGKTIVALHRAVHLAKINPDARILLTTFSEPLANTLKNKLRRLIRHEPQIAERLEIYAMNTIGKRLYERNFGQTQIASEEILRTILEESSGKVGNHMFSNHFLMTEWKDVVDAWQLKTWEMYRDVKRLGRKKRLPEKQRLILWSIFDIFRTTLDNRQLITYSDLFNRLSDHFAEIENPPFEFIIVDEAQDVNIPQLRFISAIAQGKTNALFFSGDLGQRIFQAPFSWAALGIDIRGRSYTLRINYRTSHQIRMKADQLLESKISDVDGNIEKRNATISVFNGPKPIIKELDNEEEEAKTVQQWLLQRISENIKPHETGVFVRSCAELDRACTAVEMAGLNFKILDDTIDTVTGYVSISTMHLAKGLEFRAVVVMAVDDEVMPLQQRIEMVSDDTDLEEVYNTERHLLYVACTRARDQLLITGVSPASEFIDDMRM